MCVINLALELFRNQIENQNLKKHLKTKIYAFYFVLDIRFGPITSSYFYYISKWKNT